MTQRRLWPCVSENDSFVSSEYPSPSRAARADRLFKSNAGAWRQAARRYNRFDVDVAPLFGYDIQQVILPYP
jgi:hypothetical protein